jgi:hypothetical protein
VISLPRPTDIDLVAALVQSEVGDDAWSTIRQWAEELPATATVERAQLLGLAAAVVPPPETTCPPDPQASHRASRPIVTSRGGARAGTDRPLVVDLSALWAGPLCASLLAATGAEIVKVEDVNRLDGARDGPARFYDLLHAGHRSLTVDLATPAGRRQLVDLVDAADVVIESSRPRALQQLGIDAFDAVARGTVWTSITAYGRSGPWSNRVGFGDDVAAAAGLVATIDGVPVPCGDAIADPLAGAHAAAAAAAALLSDTGYLLDVSMRDVAALAASLTAEPCDVVGRSETGWTVEWAGGRCPVATPTARPAARSAAAPGADNDTILTGRAAS